MVNRNALLCCVGLLLLPGQAWSKAPFEAAQDFYESGQETEARRALEQELRLRPANLEARFNLAVLLTHIGHHDTARSLYEKNIGHGWHLPSAVNLSSMYVENGNSEKARELLLAAAKRFRSEAVPYYLLAEMAARDGNAKQAGTYFRQALKADALNGFAHLRYARFLASQKRFPLALKHGKRSIKLLPECAPCWQQLGSIQQQAGKLDEALASYQHSAALKPDKTIRERMIAVLEAMGENERASAMKHTLKPLP